MANVGDPQASSELGSQVRKVGRPNRRGGEKRGNVQLYTSTLDRWNSIRNSLSLTHDNLAVLLLDCYEANIKSKNDDRPPPLAIIKTENTDPFPLTTPPYNSTVVSETEIKLEPGSETLNDPLPYDEDNQEDLDIYFVSESSEEEGALSDDSYKPPGSVEGSDNSSDADSDTESTQVQQSCTNQTKPKQPKGRFVGKENHPLIVYKENLLNLSSLVLPVTCNTCNSDQISNNNRLDIVGSGCSMTWTCVYGHVCHTWYSQPRLRKGVFIGDVLISATTILSDIDVVKVLRLFNFLEMPSPASRALYRFRSKCILPVIDEYWEKTLNDETGKDKNELTVKEKLDAIDSYYHKGRPVKRKKNGETVMKRKFNQKTKHLCMIAALSDITYEYVPAMLQNIVAAYNSNKELDLVNADLEDISPNEPVPPSDTEIISSEKKSRCE